MLVLASAAASVIPLVLYYFLIRRFEDNDKEKLRIVVKNYMLGAVGAIILSIIISGSISVFLASFISNSDTVSQLEILLLSPVIEELVKGSFLLIAAANFKFDNLTDGIVYGGAIGLGFGMTENFFYFIAFGNTIEQWITLVVVRTFFSAVMHCVATAVVGASIGYAKIKGYPERLLIPAAGILTAILVHFSWNYSVNSENTIFFGFLFMFYTIAVFTSIYYLVLNRENRIIFDELYGEVLSGLIPHNHLLILNSKMRNKKGWIEEHKRRIYIKSAITLAFRKEQMKHSDIIKRGHYEKDIADYRSLIKSIIGVEEDAIGQE